MALSVAGVLVGDLGLEAGGLVFGVVELGETVGVFAAGDEELKRRWILGCCRTRGPGRDLDRVVDDEGRGPELLFDGG